MGLFSKDPHEAVAILNLGTAATIAVDGEPVHVQVCGLDERHGVRVSNRMWGGHLDMWLPLTELTTTN